MRLGVIAPRSGGPVNPAAMRAAATAAEQVGYASVWLPDGLCTLDPVALVAAAAAVTSRVRLGVSVFVVPWYPPAMLARSLTSLDVLSEGRLNVGLGLGRHREEGMPSRAEQLETLLDLLEDRWLDGPEEHRPTQRPRPPLLLAASTPAGLDRVARRADGWHPAGVALDDLAPMWTTIRDGAAFYGRDPEALQLVVRADLAVARRPLPGSRAPYHGNIEQIADDLDRTRDAGANEVVLAVADGTGFDDALDAYARIAETIGVGQTA